MWFTSVPLCELSKQPPTPDCRSSEQHLPTFASQAGTPHPLYQSIIRTHPYRPITPPLSPLPHPCISPPPLSPPPTPITPTP